MPQETNKNYTENPRWRPSYVSTSQFLQDIGPSFQRVKEFVRDRKNAEFVKGYSDYYRILYITECNRGENTGTQSFIDTEKALKGEGTSRNKTKTENLSKAIRYLFGDNLIVDAVQHDLTPDLAKSLNKIIADGLFEGGCYRKTYTQPSGYNFVYLAPHLIEKNMNELFDDIRRTKITFDNFYHVASKFLVRFLYIHPFNNGNGRTGRLLLSTLLLNHSIVPLPLFVSSHNKKHANDIYLDCIAEAQQYNNFLLMNSLVIESIYYTLHNFINALEVPCLNY